MQYASREEAQHHLSPTLVEGSLYAIRHTRHRVVVVSHRQTIYDQMDLIRRLGICRSKVFLYGGNLSVCLDAYETLLQILLQTILYGGSSLFLAQMHWCKHHESSTRRIGHYATQYILHTVLLHLVSAYRTESMSDSGKEHTQILVYLGAGAHSGTRISAAHLLLYGYGRRNTFDVVTLGFAHTTKKLTSITGKALHIAALTLGIQSIEGKA